MRASYADARGGGAAAMRQHERLAWLLAGGASELYVVVQLVLAATRPELDRLLLGGLFGCAAILLVAMATSRAALAQVAAARRGRAATAPADSERLGHDLANQLSLAVGYCALVAVDPRLPQDLRELIERAQAGAGAAAEAVRRYPQPEAARLLSSRLATGQWE